MTERVSNWLTDKMAEFQKEWETDKLIKWVTAKLTGWQTDIVQDKVEKLSIYIYRKLNSDNFLSFEIIWILNIYPPPTSIHPSSEISSRQYIKWFNTLIFKFYTRYCNFSTIFQFYDTIFSKFTLRNKEENIKFKHFEKLVIQKS